MDGGVRAEGSLATRSSIKRRYSTMAESHRNTSPMRDPHYHNEHQSRRPRLFSSRSRRYVGDGLDFRRPAMSSDDTRADSPLFIEEIEQADIEQPETIDLTRETLAVPRLSQGSPNTSPPVASEASRRPVPLPRFSRHDIIDISSGEEEDDTQPLPMDRNTRWSSQVELTTEDSPNASYTDSSGSHWTAWRNDMNSFSLTDEEDSFMSEIMATAASRRTPSQAHGILRNRRPQQPSMASQDVVDLTDDDVEFIESRSIPAPIEPTLSTGVRQTSARSRLLPFSVGTLADIFRATSGRASRLGNRVVAHYNNASEHARQSQNSNAQSRYPERQFNGRLTAAANAMQRTLGEAAATEVVTLANMFGQVPGMLDYQTTGFDLVPVEERRVSTPTYQAPPSPAEGFTRNPAADEAVVCPNCGDELAQGEQELKRQVWVIKGCGHAYCGSCVDAKLQHTSKKKPSRRNVDIASSSEHPLLKKCVIDGCGKTVTKNTVIHIYLSG